MYTQDSIAVFTTPERIDIFRSFIGEGADYRVDPYESVPLDIVLENLRIGGCALAICDEDHFFGIEHLADGLSTYLNKHSNKGKFLRLVVVCQKRNAGDSWLNFLAGYLGIYDIVYGVDSIDAAKQAARLIEHGNERVDIVPLLLDPRDVHANDEAASIQVAAAQDSELDSSTAPFDIHITVSVEPKQASC